MLCRGCQGWLGPERLAVKAAKLLRSRTAATITRTNAPFSVVPIRSSHHHANKKEDALSRSNLQKDINRTVQLKPQLVTLKSLLRFGRQRTGRQIILSAQFLQHELPIRLAHRIKDFQALPFIVGCNPYIKTVYEIHLQSYAKLRALPMVSTPEENEQFQRTITEILDNSTEIVQLLAKGITQCQRHMPHNELADFLDRTLQSRIGVRMMAEHYLAMNHQKEGFIGIVCENLSPALAVEKSVHLATSICETNYGIAPAVKILGHKDATFPYIPMHLDYILLELLKNSFRAVTEKHKYEGELPPIEITICKGKKEITLRISDQGGGIPAHLVPRVFDYAFTTAKEHNEKLDQGGLSLTAYASARFGPMAGLGFGLPMAREYARYFGGSLNLYSMHGHGVDVYLKLNHLGDQLENQRIF